VLLSLRLGAGAIFDVAPGAVLSPEMSFLVPLTDISGKEQWSVGGFQLALSAYYRLPM
jgi:hypothetical protein